LAECNKPEPKDDEVLIKIFATSVTNSDLFIRGSKIPLRFLIPMRIMMGLFKPRKEIIGEVLSGEIVEVGAKIKRFKVGDEVYGLTGFSLGAYAEYKCMKDTDSKQGCIAVKPKNISHEEATSAAYGGLLAFQALEKWKLQAGQKVLIYGASGTTGTMAIQYAKALGAEEVTAVCSTQNFPLVQTLGADKVLNYTDDRELSKLDMYDIVLDAVGKARTSNLKKACRKSLGLHGQYFSIDDEALILSSERLNSIRDLVESWHIKPINDRCYPLEQIVEAHHYVEKGHKKGNVAITVKSYG
jgi:NADPH:quinone reductase-like Zn-dependent oxidoreductase